MTKYRVSKCTCSGCQAHHPTPWRVISITGKHHAVVSRWPGQGSALDAALELAGLAKPKEATC